MNRIIFYSGGLGSFLTAHVVKRDFPNDNIVLLFTDTKMEDEDLYRFLRESAEALKLKLVEIADGRNPWEVFSDVRLLGNSRLDPCSRILKREIAHNWVQSHYRSESTILYVGIDWTEEHRLKAVQSHWSPFAVDAPLTTEKLFNRQDTAKQICKEFGIAVPRLYGLGFAHNNCGGFCIKAGHSQFYKLLKAMPERFSYHEDQEERIRAQLGRDVSILRDRKGGRFKPLTLAEFRKRAERDRCQIDLDDIGGCGCFV